MKEKNYTLLSVAAAALSGFAAGFVLGAAIVAIIDYRDEKREQLRKLRRDSDENYFYSTD